MAYPFVESPNVTRKGERVVDLVVIHTMEAPERLDTAEAVARWFARPDVEVSAHYCVDADSVVQCVLESDVAWHARGANARSIGIELAGYAGQGPKGWDDDYSWAVLGQAATLTAEVCLRHGIPPRRLRTADLLRRRRGITGHVDVSQAFRRSDHWDPGPTFPWERFLRLVRVQLGVLRAPQARRPGEP